MTNCAAQIDANRKTNNETIFSTIFRLLKGMNNRFHDRKLYVRNANDEQALRQYFSQFGALDKIVMKENFAFVLFRNANDCAAALRLNSRPILNGIRTQCSFAIAEQQQRTSENESTQLVCECGESLKGLVGADRNRHRTSFFFFF